MPTNNSYAGGSLSLRRHAHGTLAKRLMHMVHLTGNTSGMSKSSSDWLNFIGFPGGASVAFIFGPPGNKAQTCDCGRKTVVFT